MAANGGDNTVSVLRGNGDGTFLAAVSYPVNSGPGNTNPSAVFVGDLNGDNLPDIAVLTILSGASVLQGKLDGTLLPAVPYSVGSSLSALAAGDFNGDGRFGPGCSRADLQSGNAASGRRPRAGG
ncbi:MAG: VCBS repeat-containing protein [Acidobacteriota bacterium]|nr:VCBS repeat-containing protein [Acidobacteriota bacterium]